MAEPLKIFISSPGDVSDERLRAALVVSRLRREFVHYFGLSAVLWEYEPMLGSGHFQDIIEPPERTDIVVVILWSRLGTPLPVKTDEREYRGLDGHVPVTGTEWEYENALAAWRRNKRPALLVYRKFAAGVARFSTPRELEDVRRQMEALEIFWRRYFEAEDGALRNAFNRFDSLDQFEAMLEQHLRELLRRLLSERRSHAGAASVLQWTAGSPYRGLKTFDLDHAGVFFGRERAEREITEALVRGAAGGEGAAFMLLLGASGSGKSSLVRAGLLPDLMTPGVVTGVSTWRRLTLPAGELAGDVTGRLAAALLRDEALPELGEIGCREAELQAQLAAGAQLAVMPLRLALERAAAKDTHAPSGVRRQGRLVLVLDQLEVVFTSAEYSDDQRRELDRVLATLARSGLVWVIATLRSDFYHRLPELPEVSRLAGEGGQYTLMPPSAGELEQIVKRPAAAAGLEFEVDERSGVALDAEIRESASRDPASLPLLSFVLDEVYRRDVGTTGGTLLTYRTYRELGGLEGAIARHAEQLVTGLSPELVAALPALLLSVVEAGELHETATARTVRRASLADPAQRALADQFVAARLMVTEDVGAGATLRLAHEALLAKWPRLAELIEEQREFLRTRRRMQSEAAAWERHGRHADFLLPAGRRLAEAAEVLSERRAELDTEIVLYIESSLEAEREREATRRHAEQEALRRELRRSRRIVAVVSTLLVLALAGGGLAIWAGAAAVRARDDARAAYAAALSQAADSIRNMSDNYEPGGVSTKVLQAQVEIAQRTVGGLRQETDRLTAARVQLLDVLSFGYAAVGDASKATTYAAGEVRLAEVLTAKDRASRAWKELLAKARRTYGDALALQGKPGDALTQHRGARDLAAELAKEGDDRAAWLHELAKDQQRIGDDIGRNGDLDGDLREQRAYLELTDREAARHPQDTAWRRDQSFGHERVGDILQAQGKLAEAENEYRSYQSLSQQLADVDASNAIWMRGLWLSHERLGDVRLLQNDLAGALSEYQTYMTQAQRFVDGDASNALWQRDLAIAHQRIGEVRVRGRDYASALKEFSDYLAITERLSERDPGNRNALYDLSNALQKVGDALRELGRLPEASDRYRRYLAVSQRLVDADASSAVWQRNLALAHQRMGLILAATQDTAAAQAEYRLCLSTPAQKALVDPRNNWPPDVHAYCSEQVAAKPSGK